MKNFRFVKVMGVQMPKVTVDDLSIDEAERLFIEKRDRSFFVRKKKQFDRARATLKAASIFGAELDSAEYKNGILFMKISFGSLERMRQFDEEGEEMINSSAM